jgi:hypothetical protein
VKLDFTAQLIQQARNYGRFADRVWLAVPVLAEAAEASTALRDFDPMLYGILTKDRTVQTHPVELSVLGTARHHRPSAIPDPAPDRARIDRLAVRVQDERPRT